MVHFNKKCLIGYMLIILFGSMIPGEHDLGGFNFTLALGPTLQNLLHVPVFALLAVLMLRDSSAATLSNNKSYLKVFIFCTVFGAFCELIQFFVPGRYAGLGDILLNMTGASAGIGIYHLLKKERLRATH